MGIIWDICPVSIPLVFALATAGAQTGCSALMPIAHAGPQGMLSLLTIMSDTLHVSVIAETRVFPDVDMPAKQSSVQELIKLFDPNLRCEVVDASLLISDPSVSVLEGNELNYAFKYFEMPSDIDRLKLMLRSRLEKEPFQKETGQQILINPGSGYVSPDSARLNLKIETFHDRTAREILLRAASEQTFVSVILFPRNSAVLPPREVWQFASEHWV